MFNRKFIPLICAALIPLGVAAEGDPHRSAADEIRSLNEEIAILSARLKSLELEAQVRNKQKEIDQIGQPIGGEGDKRRGNTPVVKSIEGVDGQLRATLSFGDGVTQTAQEGDPIPDGWKVSRISVNSVTLVRGNERRQLGFGSEPPRSRGGAQGMPGFDG